MKHLLPPLSADHKVPPVKAAGEWQPHPDFSLLQTIASGLRVARLNPRLEELVSAPDVWAQVEVFRAALFEARHPLHGRAVEEWRGLIATLALKAYHDYDISTRVVELDAGAAGPFVSVTQKASRSVADFMAVLCHIRPSATLSARHDWNEIGLISLDGTPIGLVIPSTLLCPVRRLSPSFSRRLPWISQGQIVDPATADDMSREEVATLVEFCREALEGLRACDDADAEMMSGLIGAFEAFNSDLALRLKTYGRPVADEFKSVPLHLELPQQPLYPLMGNVKRVHVGAALRYETVLPLRSELKSAVGGLLIIDPDMPKVLGAKASEIRLWGGHSLQRLLDQPELRATIEREAQDAGFLCVEPQDLFTPKLCNIDGGSIEWHPQGFKERLLPLTPAVLAALTADELREAVGVTSSNGTVTVTLRLNLANAAGKLRPYTVRKIYGPDDILNRELPTTLSSWPDFVHPEWKWHLTYFSCNLSVHFAPRMFLSASTVAHYLAGGTDRPSRVQRLHQLMHQAVPLSDRLPLGDESKGYIRELHKSEAAPEALYCECAPDRAGKTAGASNDREATGIMLLPPPKTTPSLNEKCEVGVDFGTTNTSVYWRLGAAQPEPLIFKNRLVSPLPIDDQAVRDAHREFLPLQDIDVPFMTVLRDRNVKGAADKPLPVWTSFIYFVSDLWGAIEDLSKDRDRPLRFTLKWSTNPEDRVRTQLFLAQTTLQALAEVVAQGLSPSAVRWRFSYPEAFLPDQLRSFRASSANAVRLALDPSGVSRSTPELSTESESLSTALYFIDRKRAPSTEGLVTIDIGGHTSDVSIWQDRRLIWRSSVELAGRHIVIGYLVRNIKLVELLAGTSKELREPVDHIKSLTKNPEKLAHALEILLNSAEFSQAFTQRFPLVDGEAVGRGLRAIAELALAGILHYVGRTIRHLADTGRYERIANAQVLVCLGGRASRLYSALFESKQDLASTMGVFAKATEGVIKSADIMYTDHPKHEVAYGLLVERQGAANLDLEHRVQEVLLGETVNVGRGALPADALTADLDVASGWRVTAVPELRAFLANLQAQAGITTTFSEKTEQDIVGRVNEKLAEARDRLKAAQNDRAPTEPTLRGEATIIEPPFMVALRELVQLAIEGKVTVRTAG